jgi:excisionase family DNA binding protein
MKLMSRKEVCEVLKCSYDTFTRHQARGMKTVRIGTRVYVTEEELERFQKIPRRGRGRPKKLA